MFFIFGSSVDTEATMLGKSSLNADAAPYVPVSKKSDGDDEAAKDVMGYSEKGEEAVCYQLPDNVSLEQSLVDLHVSDKLSSDKVDSYYSDRNAIHEETSAAEKQSFTDDSNMTVDFLMSQFPGYSAESLAEFLDFNNGNLVDTVDWLEEFEVQLIYSDPTPCSFVYLPIGYHLFHTTNIPGSSNNHKAKCEGN